LREESAPLSHRESHDYPFFVLSVRLWLIVIPTCYWAVEKCGSNCLLSAFETGNSKLETLT